MLNWLDDFWNRVTGTVGAGVAQAIHWAEHAIASVVLAVFRLVGGAWSGLAVAMQDFHRELDNWAQSVLSFGAYVLHHVIPALAKWAAAQLARLAVGLAQLARDLRTVEAYLVGRIEAAAAAVTRWVADNVYRPLKAYADMIWDDLKKWGYTSWWYITHPQSLADLLLDPLTNSIEKSAWQVASRLSTFSLALIQANLGRIARLIEDVISAVF